MRRLSFVAGAAQLQGPRTEQNDACFVSEAMIVVADGAGAGAEPRQVAHIVTGTADDLEAASHGVSGAPSPAAVVSEARRRLRSAEQAGATTVVVAGLDRHDVLTCGSLGDSTLLVLRDGFVLWESPVHHVAEESGTPGRAGEALSRYVTASEEFALAEFSIAARPGDLVIACTDGVTAVVNRTELVRTVLTAESTAVAVDAVLGAVDRAGAVDNATVCIASIKEDR